MSSGGTISSFERSVLNDNSLSRGERACAYELFSMMRGRPFTGVEVSQANLAARLGVCVRTVRRYLRGLRLAGYLEAVFQRRKVGGVWVRIMSRYRFVPRANRVLMRARALMQQADHAAKAVARIAAAGAKCLQDNLALGVATRDLKGEANASHWSLLGSGWCQNRSRELAYRDNVMGKCTQEMRAIYDAIPDRY